MQYKDQNNNYLYTAPLDGVYRFQTSEMVNGFNISMYIYDSDGYRLNYNTGIGQNQGLTVSLEAGKTYKIIVKQYSDYSNYTLMIGEQRPTVQLTGLSSYTDRIEFYDQRNVYTYTPSESRSYSFMLSDMMNGFRVSVYIYNDEGYRINYNTGMGTGNTVSAEMTAGKEYKIYIDYYSECEQFTLNIA